MERIGAIVLLLMALLVGAVLGLEHAHLRPGVRITVEMRRIGVLKEGAPVRLSGLVLGRVDGIKVEPGPRVLLDVWIDGRYVDFVRENADLFVAREGLFGDGFLALAGTRGEPGATITDGAIVQGDDPAPMENLASDAERNYTELTKLLDELRPDWEALRAALAQVSAELEVFDPLMPSLRRLREEVQAVELPDLAALDGVAEVASQTRAELHRMRPRLTAAAAVLDRLGRLANDPRIQQLSAALGEIGTSIDRVERVLAIIDELRAWVASGRGTIGALMQDVEISDEFRQTRRRIIRQPWLLLETERRKLGEAKPPR